MASKPREISEREVRARLEAAIAAAGSQHQLAAALGVSDGFVANIRAGRRPATGCILDHLGLRCERVSAYRYFVL